MDKIAELVCINTEEGCPYICYRKKKKKKKMGSRESLEDDPRSGRPVTVATSGIVT